MVIWTGPGHRWNDIGLAVPCSTCGAFIGKPCTAHYAQGDKLPTTHRQRREEAEAHGFRLADGAREIGHPESAAAPQTGPTWLGLFGEAR